MAIRLVLVSSRRRCLTVSRLVVTVTLKSEQVFVLDLRVPNGWSVGRCLIFGPYTVGLLGVAVILKSEGVFVICLRVPVGWSVQ